MITGTYIVPRVLEESICRTAKDYKLSEIGDYKIHGTTLMTNIPFEEAKVFPEDIDDTIFINDEETKLELDKNVNCQNFLTTKYVGRAPLEFYGPVTKMGREFILICHDGNPAYNNRIFGTKDSIYSYNKDSNENIKVPKEKA
jgi:hypothetical protein